MPGTSAPLRVLIAPMAVAVASAGPFGRAEALARAARQQGHTVALCAATDPNYRPVPGVPNFPAPVPSPYGTPLPLGKAVFRAAMLLFRNYEMPLTSFEQALHIIGATTPRFFGADIGSLRHAIREFRPEVVVAVERPAAIVAARLESARVVTSYSLPMGKAFASNPEYNTAVNRVLQANGLPSAESVLDVFDWADRKIVPSSAALEPMSDPGVAYVGAFRWMEHFAEHPAPDTRRDAIVAYMGSGGVSPRSLVRALESAFDETRYSVYLSTREMKPFTAGRVHVGAWFDFDELLPSALVSIHHGGQNSVVSALLYGVPQIVRPGRHYERRYNALSVKQLHAGKCVEAGDLTPPRLRALVQELTGDPSYAQHAAQAGRDLAKLGGFTRIMDILREVAASEPKPAPR
jgi:hypothetical protein